MSRSTICWVVCWVVTTASLLFGFHVPRETLFSFLSPPTNPSTFNILARDSRSGWNFRYSGSDGLLNSLDDVISKGDIHVICGKPVSIRVDTSEMVALFSIPELSISEVVIPGKPREISILRAEPGEFTISARPLCGLPIETRPRKLIVEEPHKFIRWWKSNLDSTISPNHL